MVPIRNSSLNSSLPRAYKIILYVRRGDADNRILIVSINTHSCASTEGYIFFRAVAEIDVHCVLGQLVIIPCKRNLHPPLRIARRQSLMYI